MYYTVLFCTAPKLYCSVLRLYYTVLVHNRDCMFWNVQVWLLGRVLHVRDLNGCDCPGLQWYCTVLNCVVLYQTERDCG